MRFTRYFNGDYSDTALKRAAAKRRQLKERASLPLFAEQVKATQPSIDTIMEARAIDFLQALKRDRKRTADKWLCARYLLRKLPTADAQMLRDYWQLCKWPGTPVYFLMMLDMFNNGNLPAINNERRAA